MKRLFIIGLMLIITSCSGVSTRTVDQDTLSTLQNRTLSLIIHESPGFMAMTSDKSMFHKAEVDKAFVDGNLLLENNGIKDPANIVSKMVAQVLAEKYELSYNENSMIKTRSKKVKDLLRLANKNDFMLDVETVYWHFINKEYKQPEYYVRYVAKFRLIDANRGKLIGEGTCDYDTLSAGKPLVGYGRLIENDAAYIKQALKDATSFCVNEFSTELAGSIH